MTHALFKIILGYLLWKHFPSWLRLQDTKSIDHYIIVGLSLIGILMMLAGAFNLIGYFFVW